jgi:hypothetical protein
MSSVESRHLLRFFHEETAHREIHRNLVLRKGRIERWESSFIAIGATVHRG